MPAYITPIQHTRTAFLKPANGLRFGNFDGVVHLPPLVPKLTKLSIQSFSNLNNQQIYKTVCDWYEGWRPWQQKVLLCGIVDRCTIHQVDMLATTLEPVRHRDYIVAVKHHYPTTPLKKSQTRAGTKRKKKMKIKSLPKETKSAKCSPKMDSSVAGTVTPESVIEVGNKLLTPYGEKILLDKLVGERQLSVIHQERTKEFISINKDYQDVDSYAGSLACRIIVESIPKTVKIFDSSELYAQDLASSIMQQALTDVIYYMNEREKSIQEKTEKIRLLESYKEDNTDKIVKQDNQVTNIIAEVPNKEHDIDTAVPILDQPSQKQETAKKVKKEVTKKQNFAAKEVDLSILNKYMKYKPPKGAVRANDFFKKESQTKSLVKVLIPEEVTDPGQRSEGQLSRISRSMSAVTRTTLSNLRYSLFGVRSLATPDYFRQDGVNKLHGGMLHLRQGEPRRLEGLQHIPVPMGKMFKSIKWWTEPHGEEGNILLKAQKMELGANFKEQLQQVWEWMILWEDFEKLALLQELLKLCGPDDLNFICVHLQQKLQDTRDINRLSDKLLLYIFSFLSADEIHTVKKVCRRWRYLCATDDLWMIKCHELGLQEGIRNLEKMIVKAKGYRMVIDWRLAYEQLKKITYNLKKGLKKPSNKRVIKGRAVQFKEQLEMLKQRVIHEKEKERAASRGTPAIVELEVHRGTLSAIHGQELRTSDDDDDDGSVVSEDLREFDDEYRLKWNKKIEYKPAEIRMETPTLLPTVGNVVLSKSEDKFDRMKQIKRRTGHVTGLPILRNKIEMKEVADDAAGDDAAYDIRPELVPAEDILGKAKPYKSLQWQQQTKKNENAGSDSEEDKIYQLSQKGYFVGEVRSVLRARKLQGHMNGITCIQFDQRRLVSAGMDRVIRMWDIRSGRSLHKFHGHKGGIRCLHFHVNELASGSWDTTIMIWDLVNLCRKLILTDHSDSVTCLNMNQDFLVSGSSDCTVRIWRRSSYLCCNVIRGHKLSVTDLAFDGSHVLSASNDKTLRLSNIVTGECVCVFGPCDEPMITVTMKGSLVISADLLGHVFFWNKQTGECEAAICAHADAVNKVAYANSRFFTASGDGSIREWDLITMTSVRLLQGHKGPVRDIQVSADRIVSCSDDCSIRIWDLFDRRKKTSELEQIRQLHQESA